MTIRKNKKKFLNYITCEQWNSHAIIKIPSFTFFIFIMSCTRGQKKASLEFHFQESQEIYLNNNRRAEKKKWMEQTLLDYNMKIYVMKVRQETDQSLLNNEYVCDICLHNIVNVVSVVVLIEWEWGFDIERGAICWKNSSFFFFVSVYQACLSNIDCWWRKVMCRKRKHTEFRSLGEGKTFKR